MICSADRRRVFFRSHFLALAYLENVCNEPSFFFEYDAAKSPANAAKHGIDFEAVQERWDGVVVAAPARFVGEDRMMAIGQIDGKYWTAIVTPRGPALRINCQRTNGRKARPHGGNHRTECRLGL